MTLTAPVSSSRVTKTVPLAVSGRCRCVTRPLARASRPCGKRAQPLAGLDLELRRACARSSASGWRFRRQAERAVVGERVLGLARRARARPPSSSARVCAQHLGRPGVDAGHRPGRLVAVAGEAAAAHRRRPARPIAWASRRARRARSSTLANGASARAATMRCASLLGQAVDAVEAEAHRRSARRRPTRAGPASQPRSRARSPSRSRMTSTGAHLDAVLARVAHQLRRRVEAHRLGVEQAAEEGVGVVALDPAADVGEQREAGGMALREAVFAEALDLLEDALGVLGRRSPSRPCGRPAARGTATRPPRRFQAAIARRSASASPAVKSAASMAICITCSWKIGTPLVRAERRLELLAGSRSRSSGRCGCCRYGMDHAALDRARAARSRPRPPGRSSGAAAGAAACSSAPGSRSGTRRRCRRGRSCRRWARRRRACPASRARGGRAWRRCRSSERRIALSMPRARMSTLSRPSASRSSLSHWMTLRSFIARVLDRHQLGHAVAGDDEAAGVLRQVARKADQLRGELDPQLHHRRLGIEAVLAQPLGGDAAAVEPVLALRRPRRCAAGRCRARGRRRAAPSAAGS